MKFNYEAISGQEIKDSVEAESSEDALAKIRNMGYFPTRIREAGGANRRAHNLPPRDQTLPDTLVLLLWIAIGFCLILLVPFVYWWNHDSFSLMQVVKNIWYCWPLGLGFIVAALWWDGK